MATTVVIDNISGEVPGFTVTVANMSEQVKCSYYNSFTDSTVVSDPGFDNVEVKYKLDELVLGVTKKGQIASYGFSQQGTFTVRQTYTIYEYDPLVADSRETILYQAYDDFEISILEWKPSFEIGSSASCYIRNTIGIVPSTVELNNNVCGILPDVNSGYLVSESDVGTYDINYYASYNDSLQTLTYKLYKYDSDLGQFVEILEAEQTFTVVDTVPENYEFTYETEELGAFKLVGTLTNCCMFVQDELVFSTCDSLQITDSCVGQKKCISCGQFNFANEAQQNFVVTVYDQESGKNIHEFTVETLSKTTWKATEDGVYRFEWVNESGVTRSSIILSQCNISECIDKYRKLILCRSAGKDCCDDSFLNSRLATLNPLWSTYQFQVDEYLDLNVRYLAADITNSTADFQRIKELQKQILEICDPCKNNCSGCQGFESGNCL